MAIEDTIDAVSEKPQTVTGQSGSVTQQPLTELIEVAKHQSRTSGVEKAHRGLRFSKIVPPGSV